MPGRRVVVHVDPSNMGAGPVEAVGKRSIIRPDDVVEKIGSLFLPDQAVLRTSWGTVYHTSGSPDLLVGDRVLFHPLAGHRMIIGGVTHLLMQNEDIMGKVVEDAPAVDSDGRG